MKSILLLTAFVWMLSWQDSMGQGDSRAFSHQGQASVWGNLNTRDQGIVWAGARYFPQVNYKHGISENHMFDMEVSANLQASGMFRPYDPLTHEASIKPYRAWVRYSTSQTELRLGLQKINFGSASMLRPLMWFDQVDPRDPLQLTDGVWGLLGRYYFLNNANIWLWALYGNEGPKTWEIGKTTSTRPEWGGRAQLPLSNGEFALSYHHRSVDTRGLGIGEAKKYMPEDRYGIDGKWDIGVGLWFEASWLQKHGDVGRFRNQEAINLGLDYTLGVGNGLQLVVENLVVAFDPTPFAFEEPVFFSGSSLAYPVGLMDNISAIVYYDWTNQKVYNFAHWQRKYNRFSFYLMAYWNPDTVQLPQQSDQSQLFAGKGVQCMIVLNY